MHDSSGTETRGRTSTGEPITPGWVQQLADIARALQAEPDSTKLIEIITTGAIVNIAGAEHAGITLVDHRGRTVNTYLATDDLIVHVDEIESRTGQGPSLDAMSDHATIRIDDLRTDSRWPAFAAEAAALGVGSMLCVQLFVSDRNLGVLTLVSTHRHAFHESDETIGLLLAGHAAIALIGAQEHDTMLIARDSRDIIGQAKGILMERYQLDQLRAFAVLVRLSQDNNIRLVDIAEHLATTGRTP